MCAPVDVEHGIKPRCGLRRILHLEHRNDEARTEVTQQVRLAIQQIPAARIR